MPKKSGPKAGWWVYLARTRDGMIYTGVSTDVERRIAEHNQKSGKGSKALRGKRPVTLAYREKSPDRSKAQRREAQIKRWSRAQKLALCRIFSKKPPKIRQIA